MNIVAFAASSSTQSINKKLANYVAHRIPDAQVDLLDLNDYALPLYSEDVEKQLGKPQMATDFLNKLGSADALVVSFAEHNGNYSAAYKNLFDWCSRQAGREIFQHKPMLLLGTSPGSRGAQTVLEIATATTPRFSGDVRASLSVPNFHDHYDEAGKQITSAEINRAIDAAIDKLLS